MPTDNPLIITAALVGAEVTRDHTPYIPYTPDEIADEALRAFNAGASIAHVHGRRPDGSPTQDRDTFQAILEAIEDRCDIIVQFSTGGAVGMDVEERIQALDLKPPMATLTTGTTNFGDDVFFNDWPTITTIARRLKRFGITPEIEVFDSAFIDNARRLIDMDLLEPPLHVDFVLGVPGAMTASERNLDFLIDGLPHGSTWSVAGVGRHQFPMAQAAIERGGHVRVGLEDNIYLKKGVLAQGNAPLVDAVVQRARDASRPIASVDQARQILGL